MYGTSVAESQNDNMIVAVGITIKAREIFQGVNGIPTHGLYVSAAVRAI